MSRGLGRIEQAVLTRLRESPDPYIWLSTLREEMYPPPNLPRGEPMSPERISYITVRAKLRLRSHHEAVDRAVRSLERKGLVRSGKDRHGRAHHKAVWLAERQGSDIYTWFW
jgi:hypothetical protein